MVFHLLLIVPMLFGSARDLNEQGNRLFKKKEYGAALEKYKKAQVKDPRIMTIDYNMGCAKYEVDSLENAMQLFTKIISSLESDKLKQKACYNMGNVLFKSGNLEASIETYKQALRLNPDDVDAKINLEFARKALEQQKDQQKNQDQQQDKDKQKQDQQKQDKQNQDQQNQDKQKQDQQKQEQQKQQQQKESAENFLKSLEQDEKDAKQKSQKKAGAVRVRVEKDW